MSLSSYLGLSFELILNFLLGSFGLASISLSSSSIAPFFLLFAFWLVGSWVEAEATLMPFYVVVHTVVRGVLLVDGLAVDVM
jgi:hypothetical protein